MNRINYQILNMEGISANPKNYRSLKEDEIDILAMSIKDNGLIQPLVVYPSTKGYIIVSGHKRYLACKKIGLTQVPVHILPAPKDEISEQEMLSQSNMHRSDEQDILNEVRIANELWEAMPLEVRKAHNDKLKKRFEEKNINNKRAEFRPKHEYIRSITGLDLTNRSISRYLSEDRVKALIEAQDPEIEQEPKPTLEKPKKNRKVRSLNQMLEATAIEFSYFMSAESEETLDESTTAIINSINELILSLLRSRNQ